jgi:gliding motility-associated protein GldM
MAGGKMSPRQKMINMMYLVLMALLALNVSKEILKSFHLFEKSFNAAALNINSKSLSTMNALQTAMDEKKSKTEPYMNRAIAVRQETASFLKYIDGINVKIEEWYGGREEQLAGVTGVTALISPDQMEDHAKFYTENDYKEGYAVAKRINDARENIASYLKPKAPGLTDSTNIKDDQLYKDAIATSQLRAGNDKQWVIESLEHNPAAGVTALLSRIKNDAQTLEATVLEKLAQQVDATDYKFDKLIATVLPSSNYVMEGENYEADILLVASSSQSMPDITVGGNVIKVEGGVGKYSAPARGIGIKTFAGKIVLNGNGGGEEQVFEFENEYTVFKPAATIAATQMNLLYKGIDNPMSISVPGFAASDVKISNPGLNLKSLGGGLYNATVPSSTNREVTITATITKDGKSRVVGSEKFRVRSLPQPTAQLGGIPNDGLPKGKAGVAAQTTIIASMGAGFAYDLNYRVQGFKMIIAYKRRPPQQASSSSGTLTDQMKSLMRSAGSGDMIIIEGIRATEAKYGFRANLSPIIITLK